MTMTRTRLLMTVCAAAALSLAHACGDDEDGHDDGEESLDGDCAVISEACHHADEGEGEAHDCHELAHDNETAACTDQKDACITACEEHSEH